jgi:pimeloyl-ACP methyl ester carboxylesterase
LVLVPGLLCDVALWRRQIEALSDIADCIVGDVTRDDAIAGMAERVVAGAPDRFALAGLSMGGYVAQEIARRWPDRVLRLALMDTNARADTEEQKARRRALIDLAQHGTFKGVTPRLLPMLIHPDRMSDKVLVDGVMAMAEAVGKEAFLRQQRAIMDRDDGREALRDIRCPVLVLCGREDAITPPKVHEEMAGRIPDATMVVINHCGHLSTMERPEIVTAHMRAWLTS